MKGVVLSVPISCFCLRVPQHSVGSDLRNSNSVQRRCFCINTCRAFYAVGDTGGIVEADWSTINWNKVNYMLSIGLQPWYRSKSATPAVGTR